MQPAELGAELRGARELAVATGDPGVFEGDQRLHAVGLGGAQPRRQGPGLGAAFQRVPADREARVADAQRLEAGIGEHVGLLLADPHQGVAQSAGGWLAETGTGSGDTRSARIPEPASAGGACLPASVGVGGIGFLGHQRVCAHGQRERQQAGDQGKQPRREAGGSSGHGTNQADTYRGAKSRTQGELVGAFTRRRPRTRRSRSPGRRRSRSAQPWPRDAGGVVGSRRGGGT